MDAAAIKTLAHPLRSRLLTALRELESATATDLARELGTNTGATSYHLRRLAEVGLIIDSGRGDGKRRVWAPSEATTTAPTDAAELMDDDTDLSTAMGWLERDWLRHFAEKFGRWLDVRSRWPQRWQRSTGMNDYLVVVTAEQLDGLHEEIESVLERYRRAGAGNPEAKRVAAYVSFYPVDMDQAPRR
ncbi:MAG: winged helix-turn-helix domain-containing protein [Actinomycetia bacterium]|nr:winged helix-turn-helix domain-containing protein [Actinomycetes bacterium]